MTISTIIDGKEYITATEAGKAFGYTKDYMLFLAKEGKIDGRKIGHKWYVLPSSVEDFFLKAKIEREEKQRQVSLERKQELRKHASDKIFLQTRLALAETLVIVLIGVSFGSVGYLGSTSQAGSVIGGTGSFWENTALSWYLTWTSFLDTTQTLEDSVASSESIQSTLTEKRGEIVKQGMVLIPEGDATSTHTESIAESFSDTVDVSFDSENSGVISPVFKDQGSEESYRFLMVPVKEKSE